MKKAWDLLYSAGLWLLARRRLLIPVAITLLIWAAVQTGWLNQLGNAVTAGVISVVDSLMAVLISVAGPLIALWIIWIAISRIMGPRKQ